MKTDTATMTPTRDDSSFVPFSFGAQLLAFWWFPVVAVFVGVVPSVVMRHGGPEVLVAAARVVSVVAVCSVMVWVLTSPVGIRVGVDGLAVRHVYGWRAFIPYSELAEITESQGHFVVLRLWNDASLRFYLWMPHAGCVAKRMEWARSAFASASPSWLLSAGVLLPGSRPTSTWVRDLRALGVSQNLDSLWSVLENPAAPPVARAAAAVALASGTTPGGEARLGRSAEACASPTLRKALEHAVSPNDETLAAALGELRREVNWFSRSQ
jgi:hypothetical protein